MKFIACLVALLFANFGASTMNAQNSDYAGGPSNGGVRDYTRACSQGSFITDVEVTYADVIDRIRFRCRPRAADGTWGSGSSWTSWTTSDNPAYSGNPSATLSCGQDHFVASFNGYVKKILTGQEVLSNLSISCLKSTALGATSGTAQSRSGGGSTSGGAWSGWKSCPSAGFARGANGRSGWHVDRMRLNCTSPAAAAPAPTAAPVVNLPRWTGPADANTAAAGNWAVSVSSVTNATRYRICLRRENSTNCYYNQVQNASSAAPSTGGLQFGVTIPLTEQGTIAEVLAQGCNDQDQCGPWSAAEKMTVVPNPPTLSAPANSSSAASRNVSFSWQGSSYASAGYQLFVYIPTASPYQAYNPMASSVTGQFLNTQLNAGTTSQVIQIPNELGTSVRWGMTSCANFAGKGRRCSLGYAPRSLSLPSATSGGSLEWRWTTPLTEAHFQSLGINLTTEQRNKLLSRMNTYTIGNIINSSTDRLVDSLRCNSCHTGQATQAAATYRPTLPITASNLHRKNKTDASIPRGSAYRWNNPANTGIIYSFRNNPISKPTLLEDLFQKWLSEGAQ